MPAKSSERHNRKEAYVWFLLSLCLCASVVDLSCTSKPTDMRSLAPADSLVYLETNDLAAALQPIVDSKPFNDVAKYKPDFSALKGVQLAVAITGFETSEEKLTDEQSIGKVQPHFVAIADTHAWNYQAVKFVEENLNRFLMKVFDSDVASERLDKYGGRYIRYAPMIDGDLRRVHVVVIDSLIYFANDESAIEKCLAVRRGEADSIIKAGNVGPADPQALARGYVSTDGVGQLANLAALKAAMATSDDGELRSTISILLPKLIRDSISDVHWESFRAQQNIEDRFAVTIAPARPTDANEVLSELADSFFEDIEATSAEDIAAAVAESNNKAAPNTVHRREDHFTSTSAERRIVTDLGFIGWIIAQLNEE